jgi:hypothetical protein
LRVTVNQEELRFFATSILPSNMKRYKEGSFLPTNPSYGKYQGTWIALDQAKRLAEAHVRRFYNIQNVYTRLEKIFNLDPAKVQELAKLRLELRKTTIKKRVGLAPSSRPVHFPTPIATPQDSPPNSPWITGVSVKKADMVNRGVLGDLYAYAHVMEAPSHVVGMCDVC